MEINGIIAARLPKRNNFLRPGGEEIERISRGRSRSGANFVFPPMRSLLGPAR
jgi:hypothetical protein